MLPNREPLENRLYKYFPISCNIYTTRGTQDGMLIKFNTFYLKIYEEKYMTYNISGYRYNEQIPIFKENIPENKLREFCSQFTTDNYLKR